MNFHNAYEFRQERNCSWGNLLHSLRSMVKTTEASMLSENKIKKEMLCGGISAWRTEEEESRIPNPCCYRFLNGLCKMKPNFLPFPTFSGFGWLVIWCTCLKIPNVVVVNDRLYHQCWQFAFRLCRAYSSSSLMIRKCFPIIYWEKMTLLAKRYFDEIRYTHSSTNANDNGSDQSTFSTTLHMKPYFEKS